MKKLTIEMSQVSRCSVTQCAYNLDQICRAKAITVGDAQNPGCDTFFSASPHNRESSRIAGVGACKVRSCRYNDDYECAAESINVGFAGKQVNCLTYEARA